MHICRGELNKIREAPLYIDYIDSSIWHYALNANSENVKQELEKGILCFYDYEKQGLYDLIVAQENAYFNAKLLNVSYLISPTPIYEGSDSRHASLVSPFLFHSERAIKKRLLDKINRTSSKELLSKGLSWKILLLDDHAEKKMSVVYSPLSGVRTTKKEIVVRLLKELYEEFCQEEKLKEIYKKDRFEDHFIIHTAENINELQQKILDNSYDIILLDYLLKNGDKTEYGYEFLENIFFENSGYEKITEKIKNPTKVPTRKLFIMFISAFVTSINERIQNKGLGQTHWHMGRSACPTTTPELFKYNIFQLMKRQALILAENENQIHTTVSLLKKIYDSPEALVRRNADTYFNSLLEIRSVYNRLKKFCNKNKCANKCRDYYIEYEKFKANCNICDVKDQCRESKSDWCFIEKKCKNYFQQGISPDKNWNLCSNTPLIQSLYPDVRNYSNFFWEHLMHLVYLTAYGTIRQWPEMLEEYSSIQPYLKEDEDILKYILYLKKESL
ncbi:MAG: hypothetical protein LUE98_18885 [Tannerellaceae bacterium]|nr:hypothetical protein [Tannerellaceae bacterium]